MLLVPLHHGHAFDVCDVKKLDFVKAAIIMDYIILTTNGRANVSIIQTCKK